MIMMMLIPPPLPPADFQLSELMNGLGELGELGILCGLGEVVYYAS